MLMSCVRFDERGYANAQGLYRRRTQDGRNEDLRRSTCSNLYGFWLDRCMPRSMRHTNLLNSSANDDQALEKARI